MAIKIKPDFALAHYKLGYSFFQKEEVKEAVHHFRKTIRLRPDLVVAQKKLEMALLEKPSIS